MYTVFRCHIAIMVVEKERKYLDRPKEELEVLRKKNRLYERSVGFVAADMLASPLCSNHFDLAYCEDVLYWIADDFGPQKVQGAINEMARVVKPGGWVIAYEDKDKIGRFIGSDELKSFFVTAGLCKYSLKDAPKCSYCYQKPQR